METNKQYLGLVLKPQRPKAKGVGILQSRPGFILQLSRSGFENLTKNILCMSNRSKSHNFIYFGSHLL